MDMDIFKNKGLSGLANCGNTCYINSCMQILSHTYEINLLLEHPQQLNNIIDSLFLKQWDELRKLLWKDNHVIAPMGFLKALFFVANKKNRELFSGYQQNDVQEFFLFVIDCFHNALCKKVNMTISGNILNEKDKLAMTCYNSLKNMFKDNYSTIIDLFYGIQITQIKDLDNNILRNIPEPFSILNVPVSNTTKSIYDCIDEYCKSELLEKENAWYNSDTKTKTDVNKNIMFWSFPDILVISLKRWNINGRKTNQLITTPLTNIDLSKYVIGYKQKSYIYDLYAVSNHSGGSQGGHYTANIKNANNKWYEFNDTMVKEIQNENHIITSKAYCLFYRKKNNNN